MKKILRTIYSVYALIIFIILMLIAFPFIAFVALFGVKGGNAVYTIARIWGKIWYSLIGIRHKIIYESIPNKTHQYIFVANHTSYIDIPTIIHSLHQPYRVLGKYEMVKIPVFGYIYKCAVILVKRSSAEERAKSYQALKKTIATGLSIFIFPEGTFNETGQPLKDFYDGAFRIAIETNTPIQPIIFLKTAQRMPPEYLLQLSPGTTEAVFLTPVIFDQNDNNLSVTTLKQLVYQKMEAAILQYNQNSISSNNSSK